MGLPKEFDAGKVIDFFNGVTGVCENIGPYLKTLTPEQVLALLEKAIEMGEKTWMFQADLLKVINEKSKYSDKAIETVAVQLGMSRSYAFELYKISKKLLTPHKELRSLPNLNVGHFTAVVRAWNKVDKPVEVLKKASDEQWSTTDLKKSIQGKKVEKTYKMEYYKLERKRDIADMDWSEYKRISPRVYICTDRNGVKYLELKVFDED